ncbi:PREDICTED: hydroxymethylglutaryl-CoA lyase, mitochondrial isoform X2 [Trachymyrmex septentrionalis]|uniref:hydroxymethylglutaryl-CoA lyase, mitochondrial isoform X2 n=1 Tax=Trachymyrmex septentrionalis TaxID=34720 RepID=UPI00084F827F|nr:PREDICTED: hydroxymethylglutaryl-CoA lyase, mitochondrial isoform X2 [Trachymyrmex septentrionalis]
MIELFSRQVILPSNIRNCVWNYTIRQFSDFVKVVEVGPRDGLQNEKKILPTKVKVNFINKLSATGLRSIEVTSFVSPKWVPQMADNQQVFQQIEKRSGVSYPVLVPNMKGLESAIATGVKEIAVFGAASETFSKTNINCSIEESIRNFRVVMEEAKKHDIRTRGYISCIVGCPYEGVGSPKKIKRVLNELLHVSNDMSYYALHCHDTYGQALMNIHIGLENGIRVFDSSVAGLGGCPYAAGASGNVATEDLLYFLEGEGLETGIDLHKTVEIGDYISKELNRTNQSKTAVAILAKKNHQKC